MQTCGFYASLGCWHRLTAKRINPVLIARHHLKKRIAIDLTQKIWR
jgi:hypothetical protein